MIRNICYQVAFWLYQLIILPEEWSVGRMFKTGNRRQARRRAVERAQHWAAFCIRRTGSSVKVHGKVSLAEGQGALFVGNHQGAFDIPLLIAFMGHPIAFIAKVELRKVPLVGAWMEHIGCLFLDRDDRRQAVSSRVRDTQGFTKSLGPGSGRFRKNKKSTATEAPPPPAEKSTSPLGALWPKRYSEGRQLDLSRLLEFIDDEIRNFKNIN